MPLVDPSGPRWVKDLTAASRSQRRPSGAAAFFERLFSIMFGWLR
jgi:hypothetical protein